MTLSDYDDKIKELTLISAPHHLINYWLRLRNDYIAHHPDVNSVILETYIIKVK